MITLAELPTPSPNAIAAWLVSFVAVVMGINAVLKLTDRFRSSPPNETLGVQNTALSQRVDAIEGNVKATLASQHSQLHQRVDTIEENVKELRREIAEHNESVTRETSIHRKSLYQQIDGTRRELEGKMEANRKELAQDIKDMPGQLVALLKNTSAI